MSLDIITRAEWGARRRKSSPDTVRPVDRRAVMVHYSTGEELGREDTAEWVREIQSYHMDTHGWQDIGYNFLVDREGRVFEGRGWDAVGAHCAGYNTPAVGVCFLGDDDPGQDVPDVARAAIVAIGQEAERRAGHDLAQLGHRDKYATACPGDELEAWWTGKAIVTAPRSSTTSSQDGRTRATAPAYPLPAGRYFGPGSVMASHYLGQWQRQMARRGWRIAVDGKYGPQTAAVAHAFQLEKDLTADRLIGPATWRAAFVEPVT